MMDWNDLRYLRAVGLHGSTNAAARSLGVSQSTVQRRIVALEHAFGRILVYRQATGYELTSLGKALLPLIDDAAEAIEAIERTVKATSADGREILHLTCPEPVVGRLRPLAERFQTLYPAYRIEFVTSDRYLDLLKGEADVAFRSGDTDDALVGRKVADSAWGIYASGDYIASNGRPAAIADLRTHAIIGLDESMAGHRLMLWLRDVALDTAVVSRASSILGLAQAAKSGIGVAALPMPIAEEAGLERLFGPMPELARTWKLLTHPALRKTGKVAAFFDFVERERKVVTTIFG
jgi:DNA-binding transcriptional LysR family regulator